MTHSTITTVLIAHSDHTIVERPRLGSIVIKVRGETGWSTVDLNGSPAQLDQLLDHLTVLRSPQEVEGVGAASGNGAGGHVTATPPTPDTPDWADVDPLGLEKLRALMAGGPLATPDQAHFILCTLRSIVAHSGATDFPASPDDCICGRGPFQGDAWRNAGQSLRFIVAATLDKLPAGALPADHECASPGCPGYIEVPA